LYASSDCEADGSPSLSFGLTRESVARRRHCSSLYSSSADRSQVRDHSVAVSYASPAAFGQFRRGGDIDAKCVDVRHELNRLVPVQLVTGGDFRRRRQVGRSDRRLEPASAATRRRRRLGSDQVLVDVVQLVRRRRYGRGPTTTPGWHWTELARTADQHALRSRGRER
jgi:hypothetical protein